MAAVDIRPQVMDISAYGGDSFIVKVTIPAGAADSYVWNAQVRATRDQPGPPDASFVITPPESPGAPGFLLFTAEDSARLALSGTISKKRNRKTGKVTVMQTYTGEWDCEVRHPTDTTLATTVVQGTLTLDLDVTRE